MTEAAWPRSSGLVASAVLAAMIGAAVGPEPTLVKMIASGLASAAGFLGALALATTVAPRAMELPEPDALAAISPILASGLLWAVPIPGLGFVWTVAGAAVAALIGGFRRSVVLTALLCMLPPLIACGLRLALIPWSTRT